MAKRKNIHPRVRASIYLRDMYRCKICGTNLYYSQNLLTLDHIIPLSKGGSNKPHNLQTACLGCNRDKGNILINEDIALLNRINILKHKIAEDEKRKLNQLRRFLPR